jgi:MFS family permease
MCDGQNPGRGGSAAPSEYRLGTRETSVYRQFQAETCGRVPRQRPTAGSPCRGGAEEAETPLPQVFIPLHDPSGRALFAYLSVSALSSLSIWVLLLLPNFLQQKGWSPPKIGWAIGAFFLSYLVFQLLSGHAADRYGRYGTALAGSILGVVSGVLYLSSLWFTDLVFPARVAHAAGIALIYTGALTQLVSSVRPELRGRVVGYFGLPGFVMLGLGPSLAESFSHLWGFGGTFVLIVAVFALQVVVVSRLPLEAAGDSPVIPCLFGTLRLILGSLRSVLAISLAFGVAFAAWSTFLAPAVQWMGPGAVSSFGLGYAIGAIVTRLGASQYLETGTRRLIAVCTLLLYSLGLGLIPWAGSVRRLIFPGVLCGIGHGMFYPALSSIAAERFHPSHAGQSMALYVSASASGMFAGPPLWGLLAARTGYPNLFLSAALVLAAATLIFLLVESRYVSTASESELSRPEGHT